MRRSNATTLQDIAREAGVTAMTVSAVLNGGRSGTRVSDATRARVQEAAVRLRYRPNGVARGLSRRRMDTIGVVAVIDGNELNLYFLEVLNGILEGAASHGQNTTVFSIQDWAEDEKRILQFCDGRVDGMILLAPKHITPVFAEALGHHTPFVMIHGNITHPGADDIEVDDENGGYTVVRYLIERGHRRIAHFMGGEDLLGAQQRLAGYRRALAESGIERDDSLVLSSGFSIDAGRYATAQLLSATPPAALPTAIFCASDAIAAGCLETLAAHGLRVPSDISVVGFDDMLLARMTSPTLTTVRQPLRRMGQFAVERLRFRIDETTPDASGIPGQESALAAPHTEVFPVEIVVRDSVGPPRTDRLP